MLDDVVLLSSQVKKDSQKVQKSSSEKRPNETGDRHHDSKHPRLSGNDGPQGSAQSLRQPREYHENTWKGGGRENPRDR